MSTMLYTEDQRVSRNGLWFFLLLAPALIISLLIYQRFSGNIIFDNTLGDIPLLIIAVSYLIPAIFSLLVIKLRICIDDKKISYGWNIPSAELNEILFSEIKSLEIVEYKFVGYGFSRNHKYGMIYNVMGNKGLQIRLKSGKKVLLGTNNVEELQRVLDVVWGKIGVNKESN